MATANSSVFVINMSMIASNSKGHTRKSMMSIICKCPVGDSVAEDLH